MRENLEKPKTRNQADARRVAEGAYPFQCCAVCGLQVATALQIAHLDHDASNNAPENLARLCGTHHWMYDSGLYSNEAIRLLQVHWQKTKGIPNHKARMKDAGAKAALTRKRNAAARKAVATRLANAAQRV
jgi:predicted restriction endonuclease